MIDPGTVLAVIQMADRIVALCKHYVDALRDAPADLRSILVEISMLKTIFETLSFLMSTTGDSSILVGLASEDSPIQHCHELMRELDDLLSSGEAHTARPISKKQKLKATIRHLAWPLKETKAQKLMEKIVKCKTTISLALTTQSM